MPIPVINIARMREWEKATWASGQVEADVIRRVGKCVADLVLRLTDNGDFILIVAGTGNNGADARGAREHLAAKRRVVTLDVTNPEFDFSELERLLGQRPALIVDGLFGVGINRPLDAQWVQFIHAINAARLPILAVDVPSGLNADTGEAQGAAIEATTTLTVGAPKTGMLAPAAWRYVGRLYVASDVGFVPCPFTSDLEWTVPEDFVSFPPPRPVASHKGSYGHLAILAGSVGYHGAAVLAARGAQRARPGLITLFTHEDAYLPAASQLQAVMVQPWKSTVELPGQFSAVLVGAGLASPDIPDTMKKLVGKLWQEAPVPVIVDASALDWLPDGATPEKAVRVMTPHPGEAARLLNTTASAMQVNRPHAVRELSRRYGNCWVVLKGHQSLIGRGSDSLVVNSSGNPYLAQGGSGDVLGGYIAGLLARPALQANALKTISFGTWQHGAAADRLQNAKRNWVVEDLVDALGSVVPGR
jgi:NAD(P)H-hydrate epimerase